MRDEVRDIRYRIGDMMGGYAPDSFRRSSSRAEWMIGLGSVLAAAGISYIALRMADRRLQDVIRSIAPFYASRNGRGRPMVHGTSGAEMPTTDGRDMHGQDMQGWSMQGREMQGREAKGRDMQSSSMKGQDMRSRAERPAMRATEGGKMPGERSQERS